MRRTIRMKRNQEGVALILAMMISALVTAVVVELRWRFELGISRSENRFHGMQAKTYLEGAEQLAMVILREDAEDDETNEVDHLGEAWAQDAQPFPTDHGWVSGKIEDAHGRININAMVPERGACPNGQKKPENGICPRKSPCDNYTPAQRLFLRLLQTVNLSDDEEEPLFLEIDQAELITQALVDWLDEDSEIRGFGGAESDHYEQLTPPVSIANGPMMSVSELQVLKGMTPALYQKILPFVVALPQDEVKKINVNTAPAEVIRTLTPKENCDLAPLDAEVAQEIAQVIKGGEFTSIENLEQDPGLPSIWLNKDNKLGIDLEVAGMMQSTYFLFFSETAIGEDHVRRGKSLIKRGDGRSGGGGTSGGGSGDGESSDKAGGTSGSSKAPQSQQGITIEVVRRTDANF